MQQAFDGSDRVGLQFRGIGPYAGTERAEQLTLGRIDLEFVAAVRCQCQPAQVATQTSTAGQQYFQIEADLFAGLEKHGGAATNLHLQLPFSG